MYLYNTTYSTESRGLIGFKQHFCEINNYTIYNLQVYNVSVPCFSIKFRTNI